MSSSNTSNNGQKLSFKDKITSHLPGHKNQDKNGNGIPDRMETKTTTANTGTQYGQNAPIMANPVSNAPSGTFVTPASNAATTTTTNTANQVQGLPISGSVLRDNVTQQQNVYTEPALIQPTGGVPLNQGMQGQPGWNQDLNRDGIPDRLEGWNQGQGQWAPGYQGNQNQNLVDVDGNGIPDQWEGQQGLNQGWNQGLQGQQFQNQGINQGLGQEFQGQGFNQGQQGFGFGNSIAPNTQSFADVREAPVIIEKFEKPAVVHEILKTEEVVQVQPVIQRERERLDVYEVVQPMREREVIPTEVREAILPAQTRSAIVEDNSAFLAQRAAPGVASSRQVAPVMSQTIENAPVIHETIVQKVIEEIQPVIYKEIDRPVLIKQTIPIYEKVIEAPHVHQNILPMRDLGVRNGAAFQGGQYQTTGLQSGIQSQGEWNQGLNQDLNRDGIPDRFEQGQFGNQGYQTTGLQSGLQSQGTFGGQQSGWNQDLNGDGIPDQLEGFQGQGQGWNQGVNRGLNQGLQGQGLQGQQFQAGQQGWNQTGTNQGLQGQQGWNQANLKNVNGDGIDDSLERRMSNTTLNSQTY